MVQTAVTIKHAAPFAGMIGDGSRNDMFFMSRALENATARAFGLGYTFGTDPDKQFNILAGAGTFAGVLTHTHGRQNVALGTDLALEQNEVGDLMRRGRIYVTTEQAIVVGTSPVYVRHTTGTGTVIGAFRADADGAAEVSTLTPTVVNDVTYTVDISIGLQDFHFEFLADGTATATEICDGIRAAMVLDAVFTALVVATGTTTLVLTGQTAGQPLGITSTGDGLFTIVETTPPAPTAQLLSGAGWLEGSSGAGVALLELNLPA